MDYAKMRKVEVDNLLNSIIELKKQKDQITKEYNEKIELLCSQVEKRGLTRWSTKRGLFKLVNATSTSINKDGLIKLLGVDTFNEYATVSQYVRKCIDVVK